MRQGRTLIDFLFGVAGAVCGLRLDVVRPGITFGIFVVFLFCLCLFIILPKLGARVLALASQVLAGFLFCVLPFNFGNVLDLSDCFHELFCQAVGF